MLLALYPPSVPLLKPTGPLHRSLQSPPNLPSHFSGHRSLPTLGSRRRLLLSSPPPRVSGNGARSSFPIDDGRRPPQPQPSFLEFITSERVKVVSMLALALALCNADRVVMSVAIVPMSAARGWSRSFAGVVQVVVVVVFFFSPLILY